MEDIDLITFSELLDKLMTINIKLYNLLDKSAELDKISDKTPEVEKQIINLSGENRMHVQSVSINVPVNRTDLYGLGSEYVYDRRTEYPSLATLDISAIATTPLSGVTDKIFSHDDAYQMEIRFNTSDASAAKTHTISAKIQDAKIQSQSISQSIGSEMTFEATFSFECNPERGLLFSGLAAAVGD